MLKDGMDPDQPRGKQTLAKEMIPKPDTSQ